MGFIRNFEKGSSELILSYPQNLFRKISHKLINNNGLIYTIVIKRDSYS